MLGGLGSLLSLQGWLAPSSVEFGWTELKRTSRLTENRENTRATDLKEELFVHVESNVQKKRKHCNARRAKVNNKKRIL